MSARFNSFVTETNPNVRVLYYEVDRNDVEVKNVGSDTSNNWKNNGEYGINGTFFADSSFMMGFAINNGTHLFSGTQNYEWRNDDGSFCRPLSCALNFKNILPTSRKMIDFGICRATIPYTVDGDTVSLSNVAWGIGGINLYIGDNSITSETSLINRIKSDVNAVTPSGYRHQNGYSVDMTSKLARTAIGYKAGAKFVLAVFVKDSNYNDRDGAADIYDVRQILKNELDCTFGLMLDGGGSTQMSYKKDNVVKNIYVSRPCYCRVGIKSGVNITWNWNAPN